MDISYSSSDTSDEELTVTIDLEHLNNRGPVHSLTEVRLTENNIEAVQPPTLTTTNAEFSPADSHNPDSDSPPVGDILNPSPSDIVTPILPEFSARNAPRRALFDAFNSLNASSSRPRIAASLPGLVPHSHSDPNYRQPQTTPPSEGPSTTRRTKTPSTPRNEMPSTPRNDMPSSPRKESSLTPQSEMSLTPRSEMSSMRRSEMSSVLTTPRRSPPGLSRNNRPATSSSILLGIIQNIENYEEIMVRQKIQALSDKNSTCICNVWEKDVYEAFVKIRSLSDEYNFVAMDTEFPGIVCKYPTKYTYPNQYQYEEIRTNVDSMKLIQLGLTLMDKNGNTPPGICTWQFNFKFSLLSDIYAMDSIKMLILAGLQFQKHETDGIDPDEFAYYFITSGLVLTNSTCDPTWITFHSGYDFAYLTRILSGQVMPEDDIKYMQRVRIFFPRAFDVKYLMLSCRELHGGLQDVANRLGVLRQGCQHQAGSDSLLTGRVFFRIREIFFGQDIDQSKYNGCLFGFSTSYAEVPALFEFWRDGNHDGITTIPTNPNMIEDGSPSPPFSQG